MKVRKAIAVILVLLFALITLPTFLLRGITKTYLDPNFYEGPVTSESYDFFVGFLSNQMLEDEIVKEYFTTEDIEEIIQKYFPLNSIEEITKDFVFQMKGITEGRKDDSIHVSLMPLKENINQMADDVSGRVISQIPECTTEEEIEALLGIEDLPPCIPQTMDESDFKDPLKRELEIRLNDAIPGEFTIDLTTNGTKDETELKKILYFMKYVQMILPLFMLILILLISLIIYRPYTLIMKFTGSALALGGVLGLVGAQFVSRIPNLTITPKNLPDLASSQLAELHGLYVFLISFIVERMSTYSIYFISIGVLIIFVAMYLKHFHSPHERA